MLVPRTKKPGSKRRKVVLLGLLGVVLAGVIFYRRLDSVQITPATDAQVETILGTDLVWQPAVWTGPKVDALTIKKLGQGSVASAVAAHVQPEKTAAYAKEVTDSFPLTDQVARFVAGKPMAIDPTRNGGYPSSVAQKNLAKVFAAQIRFAVANRQAGLALSKILGGLEYIAFLNRSPVIGETDYMAKMTCNEFVLAAIEEASWSGLFSEAQLKTIFVHIPPAPDEDASLINALRWDFQLDLVPNLRDLSEVKNVENLFVSLQGDGDVRSIMCGDLDIPATIRKAADLKRIAISNCAKTWVEQDESISREMTKMQRLIPPPDAALTDNWAKKVVARLFYKVRMQTVPNSIGNLAILEIAVDDRQALAGSFKQRAFTEGHRLAILFQLYKQQHAGAIPTNLEDLKPLCPNRFPRDMYSGEGFRYSRQTRMFWSIGQNGKDDGGVGGPVRYLSPDMVWNIP